MTDRNPIIGAFISSQPIQLDVATNFLELIAGNSPVTFQTFPERSDVKDNHRLSRVLHGTAAEHLSALLQLNEQGAGVFMMVNQGDGVIHPAQKTCRTTMNVQRVRALFVDLDGAPIEPVLDCNLRPHVIVESSPGRWHAYWNVSDCPATRFPMLQPALAAKFGGDPAVKDLPRVMRVPGFLHQKAQPFTSMVATEYGGKPIQLAPAAQAYTMQEVINGLGLNTPTPPNPANDSLFGPAGVRQTPAGDELLDLMRPCGDGERTKHLTRLAGTLLSKGFSLSDVKGVALAWNEKNTPALSAEKILATCESIFQTDLRKHPVQSGEVSAPLEPLFKLEDARIDKFLDTEPPERRWVIKDFLPLGIVGGVVATGGSGKSHLLLQLAIASATGTKFVGHWDVAEPGAVICIFAEDDIDEIHRRLRKMTDELGTSWEPETYQRLRDNLYIVSRVGTDNLLTTYDKSQASVVRTSMPDRLLQAISERNDWKLAIFDPASRFRGGDENAAQDSTRFIEALEYVKASTQATILVAHHTNKSAMNGGPTTQNAQRGSAAFTDGIRWQLNLGALPDVEAKGLCIPPEQRRRYLVATLVKSNYTALMDPILLRRSDQGVLSNETPKDPASRATSEIADTIRRIIIDEYKNNKRTYSRTSFEAQYGGVKKTPLNMAHGRLRALLSKLVKEEVLFEDTQRQLWAHKPTSS